MSTNNIYKVSNEKINEIPTSNLKGIIFGFFVNIFGFLFIANLPLIVMLIYFYCVEVVNFYEINIFLIKYIYELDKVSFGFDILGLLISSFWAGRLCKRYTSKSNLYFEMILACMSSFVIFLMSFSPIPLMLQLSLVKRMFFCLTCFFCVLLGAKSTIIKIRSI